MIIPKTHVDSIEKVSLDVLNKILTLVHKIIPIYKKIYGIKGYSIMQNGGEFCDFGHFHLHVFPRYPQDGFGWNYLEGMFTYSEEAADKTRRELELTK